MRFYCGILGLELVELWDEGGRGSLIKLSRGADLELIELEAATAHGSVALGLEVEDVDGWYANLLAHGATTKAPPVNAFGKRGFGTVDPNGVPINIYTTDANAGIEAL